jgi:hypothetical protein
MAVVEPSAHEIPEADDAASRLNRAIGRFIARERSLIVHDPSERSLTHRLAIYVEEQFPSWNVDCEYNRIGDVPKRVSQIMERNVSANSSDAVTVFPDIVVHVRGTEGPNLLVIEAKKATSRIPPGIDIEKLEHYKLELDYHFAAFVILPAGDLPGAPVRWISADNA